MPSDFTARSVLVALPAFGLASGFAAPWLGLPEWQGWAWAAFTVPVLLALLYEIVSSLRRGEVGLDIVAALSMTATLAVGENRPGSEKLQGRTELSLTRVASSDSFL